MTRRATFRNLRGAVPHLLPGNRPCAAQFEDGRSQRAQSQAQPLDETLGVAGAQGNLALQLHALAQSPQVNSAPHGGADGSPRPGRGGVVSLPAVHAGRAPSEQRGEFRLAGDLIDLNHAAPTSRKASHLIGSADLPLDAATRLH